jgi:hypothetical protein
MATNGLKPMHYLDFFVILMGWNHNIEIFETNKVQSGGVLSWILDKAQYSFVRSEHSKTPPRYKIEYKV